MRLPFRTGPGHEGEVLDISPDEFSRYLIQTQAEAEEVIGAAENDLKRLYEMQWSLKYTSFILAAAVLINLGLLLAFTWRFYLSWIMAAFIFLMVNPFLLLLPTDLTDLKSYVRYFRDLKIHERMSLDEIRSWGSSRIGEGSIADTMETFKGLTRQRNYLYELGWNLFFINCQPLAPGFLVLFALCSVFASAGWMIDGEFESYSSIIVIVQSAAIIVFYIAIVYVRPYSRGFFAGVLGMPSTFKERYTAAWSQGLKYALTAAVLIIVTGIFFIAAILLPGVTYNSFVSAEADIEIGAGTFALIFLMQMIVVRHLQGNYSGALVRSLLSSRIETIREEVLPAISDLASASLHDGVTPRMTEDLKRISLDITRHRALKIDYASLFGYFPVCMVTPDVGAVMSISGAAGGGRGRINTGETAA